MAFLGISEFKWFVGVVEDRHDPQKLGRLRVRALGIHTSDKSKIATADLPWASVLLPTTSAGISGLGQSPSFIVVRGCGDILEMKVNKNLLLSVQCLANQQS